MLLSNDEQVILMPLKFFKRNEYFHNTQKTWFLIAIEAGTEALGFKQ